MDMILLSYLQTPISSVISLMFFSGPGTNPDHTLLLVACLLSLLNLVLFLSLSLSFMTSTLLKTSIL